MGGYIGATAVGLTTTAADVQGDITSTDTTPELILKNTSEEDTEGGREGKITFKGEQSGGEESTLAQIESAHDGTSDDQKGDLIFKTNDGSDGNSPTERLRIDADGKVGIGTSSPDTLMTVDGTDTEAAGSQLLKVRNSTTGEAVTIGLYSKADNGGDGNSGSITFDAGADGSAANNELRFSADHQTDTTPDLTILGSGKVGIGTSSPSANLHVAQDGNNVALYAGGGGYNFQAKFESSDAEAAIIIEDSNSTTDGNRIGVVTNDMTFVTNNSERMRISSGGDLRIGTTDPIVYNEGASGNSGLVLVKDGYYSAARQDGPTAFLNRQSSTGDLINFYYNGSKKGSISTNGSNVAYNTSSDYRLKENVTDVTDGITRVKQLAPKRFNFIADVDTTVDGFLAHEAATVVPEAITGTHNEVEVWKENEELPDGVSVGDNKLDDDGNTIPVYQGIDQSKLVPLLTAALQEAIAKIETLETQNTTQATQIADLITRVEALEGA